MPPAPFDFEARWRELSEEITAGVQEWGPQYPKATLREIEAAVDERSAELRARMLEDVDLASQVADIGQAGARDRPVRPRCGSRVEPRERQVTAYRGKTLALRRRYAVYPTCQVAFFPCMRSWACSRGQLTPCLQESLVRLGIWMPFAQAVDALRIFIGLQVSEPTVRRLTGASGAAYVAVQAAAVEAIERTLPETPAGPAVHLLSVDGAMAPLLH
jgi:hypothetical protein